MISLFQLRLQIFTCFHFKFPTVLLSWNWAICHIMSMFGLCSNPDFSVSPILNFYYFAAITSAIQVLAHFSFVPPACFVGWYVNNQLEKIWNKAVTNQSEVLSCIFLQRLRKTMTVRNFVSVRIWTVHLYITRVSVTIQTNLSSNLVHMLFFHFTASWVSNIMKHIRFLIKFRHWIYHLYVSGKSNEFSWLYIENLFLKDFTPISWI